MTLASNASDEPRVGKEQKMRLHDFLDYHACEHGEAEFAI